MLRLRTLLYDFIPPGIEVPPDERKAIRYKVRVESRGLWKSAGMFSFVVSTMIGLAMFGFIYALKMLAGDLWVPAWLVMVLVSGYFMTLALHAPGVARNTYAELRRRGYEVCPGCGYALRGLEPDAERCPECGREREPLPPPPIVKEPKKPDPLRGELPPGGFDQWS